MTMVARERRLDHRSGARRAGTVTAARLFICCWRRLDDHSRCEECNVDDNEEEVTTVNEHVEHPFCNSYNPEEEKEEEKVPEEKKMPRAYNWNMPELLQIPEEELIKKAVDCYTKVYRGHEIMTDMNARFKISISYSQAWRAKCYALELLRGSPEASFAQLPAYCHNLKLKNPGSVTHIKTDRDGRFELLFIAIGATIRSFIAIRSFIFTDTHCDLRIRVAIYGYTLRFTDTRCDLRIHVAIYGYALRFTHTRCDLRIHVAIYGYALRFMCSRCDFHIRVAIMENRNANFYYRIVIFKNRVAILETDLRFWKLICDSGDRVAIFISRCDFVGHFGKSKKNVDASIHKYRMEDFSPKAMFCFSMETVKVSLLLSSMNPPLILLRPKESSKSQQEMQQNTGLVEAMILEEGLCGRNPNGYLPGKMATLMTFYGFMSLAYLVLGLAWFLRFVQFWKDIIHLHYHITLVIALGMCEMDVWYFEYSNFNSTGTRPMGITLSAVTFVSVKKTLSRLLLLVVSMGFGVVRPTLGGLT
ncbi:hypothetical protein F3Y22_tig00113084pilonHSYRG00007 [Hibiscus syriacus]|uniref:GOST seven transmembrane domain-containing protein n=1 Tax=Hibiscus syriacus TaxID=106335 RepID=A0A6A2XMF5_HIBSY|nr:hypothetical protein F3Y22_tig00113084pilonHSYRG00007 [Hibiscus syriacus]